MKPINEKAIAIIGTGKIAGFHVKALQEVGLNVEHVASSLASKTCKSFAKQYSIRKCWNNPLELINEGDWDALVILTPTESTLATLQNAMEFDRPILVEKPITHDSRALKNLNIHRKDVMVGYNRRFYPEIQKLKEIISKTTTVNLFVEIPEKIPEILLDKRKTFYPVFQNSVHVLDLIQFLVGTLKLESRMESEKLRGVSHISALLKSDKGHDVNLLFSFNAPTNFSITVDVGIDRYILRPLEEINIFSGISIIEPNEKKPYREYKPNLVSSMRSDPMEYKLKPGFFLQALAFRNLVDGKSNENFATLESTYDLIVLTEKILGIP